MSISKLTQSYLETHSERDFGLLYERIKPGLRSYVSRIVSDQEAIDDIISNTFIKMWTKIDQFDQKWSISTWLYRIARNEALGWLNEQKEKSSLNQLTEFGVQASTYGLLLDTEVDESLFKTEIDWKEEDNDFQSMLDSTICAIYNLEDSYRDICQDRLLNGLKYQDLSEKYNLPLQTIKNRIRRGKILIQQRVIE